MALLRRLWKLIMAGTTQLASTLRFMNQLEHENVDHHVQQRSLFARGGHKFRVLELDP